MANQLKFGVIGGGIRGSMFAQTIRDHPRSKLVGFCDPNPTAATRLQQEFSVPVYPTVPGLLESGVTAVVVATPDFAHLEAGLAALNAGIHVMFEKPLATTMADADALRTAAQASTSKVMLGFENRWNPKFQLARQALQETDAILIAQRALLQDTEFVPREMLSWSARSTPGWFLMPHSLDLALWLSGAKPVEVFARGVKKILCPDGIDTYDRISASVLLSDNSLLTLESGWVLPTSRPAIFEFRYGIEAQGLELEIEIDPSGVTSFSQEATRYLLGPATDNRGRLLGAPVDMMRDFIDYCDGAELDVPTLEDGFIVTKTIARLHESLASNSNLPIN